jgi:very long chain acyl-CoA dehydrogenase
MLRSTTCIKEIAKLARTSAHPLKNVVQQHPAVASTVMVKRHGSTAPTTPGKSIAMGMFMGSAEISSLFPYPVVLDDEQSEFLEALIDPVEKFMEEENDAAINDANEEIQEHSMQGMKDMGAFGLQVPAELDGIGLNNTQYARVVEVVGKYDLGLAICIGAHQSIGFKGILIAGNDEQKEKYLPPLATGEKIAAFALTEPSSGSDANSIRTHAKLNDEGTHWILNGSKLWISNGGLADVFTVFAQTPVMDEKTGTMKNKVTAFIVERDFGGVDHGPPEKKMGIKCSNTAEVYFEDVPVPVENVIGEVGEGFKIAMQILNNGRFGMAALLSGTQKVLIKQAVEHAAQRVQFGQKLRTFGTIQEKIARMSIKQFVTESMAYAVCGIMDQGHSEFQLEAAMSKIYASEAAWEVADEAIQILGGMGYMKDTGAERMMRDIRIFRIFEGTNDILRLFVALTGLQGAGKHLRNIQKSLSNPLSNVGLLMDQVSLRAKRATGMNVGPNIETVVHPELKPQAELLSRAIGRFGASSEALLLKYKKDIIHEQMICTRFANAAIDLFGMMCVVSRTTKSLNESAETAQHEVLMTQIFCEEASNRIDEVIQSISNPESLKVDSLKKTLGDQLVDKDGCFAKHPLGF